VNGDIPTLDDIAPAGKRVLVRADLNVPMQNGRVADDTRLRAILPTLRELLDRGAGVIVMSHLGRPEGVDESLRIQPIARALGELLGQPVRALTEVAGPDVSQAAESLGPGEVMMLENLRFDPREKAGSAELARELAALADAYVNDAFGTAHRASASTVGVAEHLPAYAGRLMARELAELGGLLKSPARPFVLVMGGAKISDKVGVIDALLSNTDSVLIGGGMANTFMAADGVAMGESLVEDSALEEAARVREAAGDKLVLPADLVIADAFSADARRELVAARSGVPRGWRALDIGPETVERFASRLRDAKTVVWNGPMGAFELEPFARGTFAVARIIADLRDARTVVGGGDSAAAVRAAGLSGKFGWVSTGGGATLEFLEGRSLPAVEALRRG